MWRNVLLSSALLLFGLTLLPAGAASEEKSLREQLVGTWKIVSVNNTRPDGSVEQIFGPNPKGIAVFDPRGTALPYTSREPTWTHPPVPWPLPGIRSAMPTSSTLLRSGLAQI